MKFRRLMVLRTEPLRPTQVMALGQLFAFLLGGDPDPGRAGLRPIKGDEGWLQGEDAVAWLQRMLEEVQQAAGRRGSFYQRVSGRTAQLFVEGPHFASRLRELDPRFAASLPERPFWLGLSFDWAHATEGVFLVPQVRISNFRPTSARYAPPPAEPPPPLEPCTAEQAAAIFENDFQKVMAKVYGLRALSETAPAGPVAGREVRPPVFYFAEPDGPPGRPEDWVGFAGEARGLEALARTTLGTESFRGEGTMGTVAVGNLLMLRRDRVLPAGVRVSYLLLPSGSSDKQELDPEESEREAVFLADQLAYIELSLGGAARRTQRNLESPNLWMRLWQGSLDTATELSRELERSTVFEATGAPEKLEAFGMVGRLRMLISRLEPEMIRLTDHVMSVEQRWRLEAENWRSHARQRLTAAPVPGLAPLLLGERDFVAQETTRAVRFAVERGRRLRETFQVVGRALREMLAQEQREHRELEERRRESQRRREERRERILGYALASLAAVAAFPILIGEMDWTQIREVMSGWPEGFSWMRASLQTLHPYLVLVAILAAGSMITFLVLMILWNLIVPSKHADAPADGATVETYGRHLKDLWRCVSKGEDVLMRPRSYPEPMSELATLDKQACDHAQALWTMLEEEQRDDAPEDAQAAGRLAALGTRVRRFLFLCELLDNRPQRISLPALLCLFRYRSGEFVGRSVISDEEFRTSLERAGLDAAQLAEAVKARGLEDPKLSLKDFLDGLHATVAELRSAASPA